MSSEPDPPTMASSPALPWRSSSPLPPSIRSLSEPPRPRRPRTFQAAGGRRRRQGWRRRFRHRRSRRCRPGRGDPWPWHFRRRGNPAAAQRRERPSLHRGRHGPSAARRCARRHRWVPSRRRQRRDCPHPGSDPRYDAPERRRKSAGCGENRHRDAMSILLGRFRAVSPGQQERGRRRIMAAKAAPTLTGWQSKVKEE